MTGRKGLKLTVGHPQTLSCWDVPRTILGGFEVFSTLPRLSLCFRLKNVMVWCVIPGGNLISVGKADGFWVEPGSWGVTENMKAAASGHDFTAFHWVCWMKMEFGACERMQKAVVTPEKEQEEKESAGRTESLSCESPLKKPLSHYISSMDPQPGIFYWLS